MADTASEKDSEDEDAGLKGRRFAITTTVSVIATLATVGGLALAVLADRDKLFGPSEPSLSMKHSEFSKLPYGRQLDLCIPYVRANIVKAYDQWKSALKEWPESAIDDLPKHNAANPGGQALVNFHMTVREMAKTNHDFDVAKNLISCAYSPDEGKVGFDPHAEVGAGNARPYPVYTALSETKVYTRGTFNGFSADGRPSKIVEERPSDKRSNFRVQVGYTLVSGSTTSEDEIWVTTAEVRPGNSNWIPDLTTVDLGDDSGHP
jgi:hypothetical protein